MEQLHIQTFGVFSISAGGKTVSDAGKRVAIPWTLLAYLICNRGTVVSQKKLIELLWGETSDNRNPESTLRITLHRARGLLDGLWEGAGRELVIHKDDGYTWNEEAEMVTDFDEFDRLCLTEQENEEERLHALQKALLLYRGSFLEKQATESWVIPLSAYYHNLYVSAVMETAKLLSDRGYHLEAANVCRDAVRHELYHEELHRLLMKELMAAGDRKQAVAVYDALSKRLFDDFGIHPGDKIREQYRACRSYLEEHVLSAEEVLKHLQEEEYARGALECDYDYFRVLCRSESRSMERNGNATHICLLTVTSATGKPLAKRSTDRIMRQMGDVVRLNLRRGDAYSRCSTMQYVVMLPKANYENSCMVCRRIISSFTRAHPGGNIKIGYVVQPLLPGQPNQSQA